MSGGRFEYKQFWISDIADSIEEEINQSGRKKTQEEIENSYDEDLFHYKYPDEVINEFKKGLKTLREAAVYAQRIDWILSGDDGDKNFLERLKKELNDLKGAADI